jgi:hypothetical protein
MRSARLAALLFLSGALALSACTDAGSRPLDAPADAHEDAGHEEAEHAGEELAPYMASLQRYTEKLFLAGANEHWELARFYEHEVEEVAEELVEGGFEEDGHDVSALTQTMLLPAVARVEAATDARSPEAFDAAYRGLLAACNACHDATDHGFIRLQVPDANAFPSQDFSPGSR